MERNKEKAVDDMKPLVLLLDYDGTLTPIVAHPDLAVIPHDTREVLSSLANDNTVHVAVISGRQVRVYN